MLSSVFAHDCLPIKDRDIPMPDGKLIQISSVFDRARVFLGYRVVLRTGKQFPEIYHFQEHWMIQPQQSRLPFEKKVSCHLDSGNFYISASNSLIDMTLTIPLPPGLDRIQVVSKRTFYLDDFKIKLREILVSGRSYIFLDELVARILSQPDLVNRDGFLEFWKRVYVRVPRFVVKPNNPLYHRFRDVLEQETTKEMILFLSDGLLKEMRIGLPSDDSSPDRIAGKRKYSEAAEPSATAAVSTPTIPVKILPESEWVEMRPVPYLKGQLGLFAKKDIPAETNYAPYRGRILNTPEAKSFKEECDKNGFDDTDKTLNYVADGTDSSGAILFRVDGYFTYLQGNCPAAAANHSLTPNSTLAQVDVDEAVAQLFGKPEPGQDFYEGEAIVLRSLVPIPAGKEILIYYGDDYAASLRAKYGEGADNIQCCNSNIVMTREFAEYDLQKAIQAFKLSSEMKIAGNTFELTMFIREGYYLMKRALIFYSAQASQKDPNPSDQRKAHDIRAYVDHLDAKIKNSAPQLQMMPANPD
jgi:hypothetical protein